MGTISLIAIKRNREEERNHVLYLIDWPNQDGASILIHVNMISHHHNSHGSH